jgi:hypothetical protein
MVEAAGSGGSGRRRVVIALFVALVMTFYGLCAILYYFQFRGQIQKWWESRNRRRSLPAGSQKLRHRKETIELEAYPRWDPFDNDQR